MDPGQSQTYVWQVPPTVGPGKQDFSTVAYTYRSTVDPTAHENAGLIGAVVIGRLVSIIHPQLCFSGNNVWGLLSCLKAGLASVTLPSGQSCGPANHLCWSSHTVQTRSGLSQIQTETPE